MNKKLKQILIALLLLIVFIIVLPNFRSILDPQMPSENPQLIHSMMGFVAFIIILSLIIIGIMIRKQKLTNQKTGGSECESLEVMQ
jgi:type II secretory pathway component PulF